MDDFLSTLSFHPGHPFLILFGVGAGVAFLALGPLALRHGSRLVRAGWLLGVALLLAELVVTVHVTLQLDWNPRVERPEVVGTWEEGELKIEFLDEGRYVSPFTSGTWSLTGDSLELIPQAEGFENLHFIRFGETLRLLRELRDPDEWAGELGMRRRVHGDASAVEQGDADNARSTSEPCSLSPVLGRHGG